VFGSEHWKADPRMLETDHAATTPLAMKMGTRWDFRGLKIAKSASVDSLAAVSALRYRICEA